LAGVRYSEEVAVALLLDSVLPNDYFGLSFPRLAPPGESVAAFCAESRKDAGLAAAGREVLLVVPAPAVMAEFVAATPREALNLVLPSVELVYPGLSERIVRARSYRFPDGRVIFYPGYLQHLSHFDQAWQPERLALAGDYLISPTVEGAVRSGRQAAEYLLRGR
jgi:protoporphyrinogen oxidase